MKLAVYSALVLICFFVALTFFATRAAVANNARVVNEINNMLGIFISPVDAMLVAVFSKIHKQRS